MKVTLEIPFSTAVRLRVLWTKLLDGIDKQDPKALAIQSELQQHGIDITKITLK